MVGLIELVNSTESLSKTNFAREWGQPSAKEFAKEKYSKGRSFFSMYPHFKPKSYEPSQPPMLKELTSDSVLKRHLMVHAHHKNHLAIDLFSKTAADNRQLTHRQELCQTVIKSLLSLQNIVYQRSNFVYSGDADFYKNNVVLNEQQIVSVCCDTINQSNSKNWFRQRRLRLSASSNIHNIKVRKTKTIEKLLNDMLHSDKIETVATKYGIEKEKEASSLYGQKYGVQVVDVGVIVKKRQSWLCASCDGVVLKNSLITNLLEIKSPESCKSKVIVDEINKSCNVSYLKFENGVVTLNKNDKIYTQIQVQLYVTGLQECDLFIFTPYVDVATKKNCSVCIKIQRDDDFIKNCILKAEEFYFKHYLPRVKLQFEKN